MTRFSKIAYGVRMTIWISLVPVLAAAAPTKITINNPEEIKTKILCKLFGWGFTFLIILSAFAALSSAYLYITSGGDSERVKQAGKMLAYAAVGVAVAIFANAFPILIGQIFTGTVISSEVSACP